MESGTPDPEGTSPLIGSRRGWSLKQRLQAPDSYGLLLVLILVSVLVEAVSDEHAWERALTIALLGVTLLFALRTSRAGSRLFRATEILVPLVMLLALVSLGAGDVRAVKILSNVIAALLAFAVPAAIVHRLAKHPVVSGTTILGALCVYVLIGLFFASVYSTIAVVQAQPFFAQPGPVARIDYLYFSYVTLATLGYGDLTPAADLSRMLAVTEALTGQLYLVTVVALLVSNVGRRRSKD